MINTISLNNFTAFTNIDIDFSKGINVFIGANSTGKSHMLKLLYALCSADKPLEAKLNMEPSKYISEKLYGVFKPELRIGRLCRDDSKKTSVRAVLDTARVIAFTFSIDMDEVIVTENQSYGLYNQVPVFIPPKEMLSIFEGFSSLYLKRELTIDETYFDLSQALEIPKLKITRNIVSLILNKISHACQGEFLLMNQKKFYYKPAKGRILEVEFAAEGFRKLGMLQLLLQNGHIQPGESGPLFWDEPESNLNPSIIKKLVEILVDLSRNGQQIFIATHDYFILKWLDLLIKPGDKILFHALYKNNDEEIQVNTTDDYLKIQPNAIDDTFAELIDRDIEQSMGGLGR